MSGALEDVDGIMSVGLCNTEEQEKQMIELAISRGLRLACISNTGLVRPWRRLTFLPPSSFSGTFVEGDETT